MTTEGVLAALAAGPQTVEELSRRLGAFRTSTFSELVTLERAGHVVVVGNKGRDARYRLVEEPAP